MSIITDNVLPGKKGKIFSTNAETDKQLLEVVAKVQKIEGVTKAEAILNTFPREFKVHADEKVSVEEIQEVTKELNVNSLVKSLFEE